jgi:acetolactate synthase-1/2/3 large subunit
MRTIDVMTQILKKEGVQFLSAFPTTPVIEACAEAGIRPVICRQERVGVGIADGFTRVTNANPPGVFAMQYGPGAENAYAGVATAFSDAVPMLLLPLGHPKHMDGVFPHFSSLRNYAPITKHIEQVNSPERIGAAMRRAFAAMKMGRPGPAMVEIPVDVATSQADSALAENYQPVKKTVSRGNPNDVLAAAKALLRANAPIIHAGQGVLYSHATDELIELAELLQTPVMTTMGGKSAFPENHPLALGSGSGVMSGPVYHFLKDADVLFAIGTSLTRHLQVTTIPLGKTIIHATNNPIDISKDYVVDYPVIGDAKLVLRQFIEACRDLLGKQKRNGRVTAEIVRIREQWLKEWMPRLTSNEVPLSPYRVIHEFIQNIRPTEAIVTHDSGSPRDQIMPFYKSDGPRTYIGWGKSHGLGTGLGLIMGAKLAQPDKFCVNFMGDAAFGMVGTDFETAVRSSIPICTVVLNNSSMACETVAMASSHRLYNARDLGGNYADMASAMGGWSERVTDPGQIAGAVKRARKATESGRAALLEFITKQETNNSYKYVFNK